jgi:hypothetical protein
MTQLQRRRLVLFLSIVACASTTASAHVFIQPYTLPVPFWMYLYACAATLVLSFAVLAYAMGQPTTEPTDRTWNVLPATRLAQSAWNGVWLAARAGALVCLVVTILGGLVGTSDPRANISLTLFWVGFLLGLTYATVLVGNVYALVNPWWTLAQSIEALGVDLSRERVRYPMRLGYVPAFVLYVALIWIELFTLPRPYVLSLAALAYTSVTLAGAFTFGKHVWFTYGELFSVFFTLVGIMAPVEYGRGEDGGATVRLRTPFAASRLQPSMHGTLVLFVLFMLSSTTYDAVHQTYFWASFYWQGLLPLAQPLWGTDIVAAQAELTWWYRLYQHAGLVLSPFLYLLLYLVVLACARLVTRTTVPLTALAAQFAPTLVPIALVYHATHYATILIADFPRLLPMAADPFGLGWRLFPVQEVAPSPPLNMGVIWHSQVALILGGHVAGVYLAHKTALRVFAGTRHRTVCQLPMLVLMVAYTCLGLWVLSLPLDVPQVVPFE